jgi:hypothetical protein
LYTAAAEKYGWLCVTKDAANHAAKGETKRRMTECLWMNYELATKTAAS